MAKTKIITHILKKTNKLKNDNLIIKINKIFDFIKENYPNKRSIQSELANTSKVHLIINHINHNFELLPEEQKVDLIKRKCRILGWIDLARKSEDKIKKYLKFAKIIDESLNT